MGGRHRRGDSTNVIPLQPQRFAGAGTKVILWKITTLTGDAAGDADTSVEKPFS